MQDTTASAYLGDALDSMTPSNWAKGTLARAADGEPVSPDDPEAIEHCALGYLDRHGYYSWTRTDEKVAAQVRAVEFLVAAIEPSLAGKPYPYGRCVISQYNDATDTTYEDVVLLFKRAYEAALDAGD